MLLQALSKSSRSRYLSRLLLAMMLGLAVSSSNAQSQDYPQLTRLDKLKAAYIFNFTKFISWPDLDTRTPRETVVVCLAEQDPLLEFLQALVANRTVGERQLRVEVKPIAVNNRCDLAYLSDAQQPILDVLKEVLIVSSNTSIFQNVATFSFYEEGKRLRFEIDMQRLQALELEISSELLKLARIKKT
ncbi:YfiR family protein [Planctobacterium marinum]|uniref:Transmembrane protein n=1 Tax=Planctobacterium marinum TaxID=1631968 RepID=A0AA48HZF2_9ALTE|nr:hypothetical protein MACH26_41890 [Planctobacterium marinum]